MKGLIPALASAAVVVIFGGCSSCTNGAADDDMDSGTDGDTDADADTDADSDADADADGDTDTDSDTDVDTDTDADGDGDSDSDADTDADADTDSDSDTLVFDGGPLTPCEGEAPEGMVCVPGGTYLMGCMPYDTDCDPSELPMVEVTLSPFFIDENETTYEEVIPFLNTLWEGYYRGPTYVTKGGVLDGGVDGQVIYRPHYDAVPPVGLNDAGLYEWGVSYGENTCWQRPVDAASGCFGWLGAKEYCEWQGKRL
ncbi:MAG TPA: SUMF1/EgtB/PvdO family nonheme iron enzyme, partial [Polyangia bacterium]|nr:SUMF1/EgtB/PvdO family nonheme iron enzyme [Polyangia bacterium]